MKVWTGRATIAQTATGRAGRAGPKRPRAGPRQLGPWQGSNGCRNTRNSIDIAGFELFFCMRPINAIHAVVYFNTTTHTHTNTTHAHLNYGRAYMPIYNRTRWLVKSTIVAHITPRTRSSFVFKVYRRWPWNSVLYIYIYIYIYIYKHYRSCTCLPYYIGWRSHVLCSPLKQVNTMMSGRRHDWQ